MESEIQEEALREYYRNDDGPDDGLELNEEYLEEALLDLQNAEEETLFELFSSQKQSNSGYHKVQMKSNDFFANNRVSNQTNIG